MGIGSILKYNIDYEIMGILVTLVILVYFRMKHRQETKSEKAFFHMCVCVLGAQVTDALGAVTFSLGKAVPEPVNMILTLSCFLFGLASSHAFERYIAGYIVHDKETTAYDFFRQVTIGIGVLLLLINPVTRWLFSFDPVTGAYIHGKLYFAVYLVPFLLVLSALYLIFRYRRYFDNMQWFSGIAFVLVIVTGMALQSLFFPNLYLTYGLVSISLLMIMLSLETPDYRKLNRTLKELEKAKEEAWTASQVKSDFLANMSHEIRTPINAMLGFDEMILRESRDEAITSYAANIRSSGQTLLSLVNDILDLSRIEAGKIELSPVDYDTARMFEDVLQMIRPRAEDKGLALSFEIDSRIPRRLYGDDMRIRQALINLLTNSVKYTEKGSIVLSVSLQDTDGRKAKAKDITLFFSVKDTGIGIREEDKEKVFSAFERGRGEKNRYIEGTGLGLAITYRYLMLMEATLQFNSKYGTGSDFYFTLRQRVTDREPIGDFRLAAGKSSHRTTVYREDFLAPDARILVVDDVDMNLKVFKGLLKRTQIQIDAADNGETALRLIKAQAYDCVFLDHQMPGMDGIEALDRIHQLFTESVKEMPVIVLTANAILGAREWYLEKGFSDYLTKPIDGKALAEMLRKWLPQEKLRMEVSSEAAEPTSKISDAGKSEPADKGNAAGKSEYADNEDSLGKPEPAEAGESTKNKGEMREDGMTAGDKAYEADGTKNSKAGGASETASLEPIPDQDSLLQRLKAEGLDTDEGLSYAMDDEELYLEVVGDYAAACQDRLTGLQDAYSGQEWHDYEIRAHALKSTSKTIGANELSELARSMEFAAKGGDMAYIETKHADFMRMYEDLAARIQTALEI